MSPCRKALVAISTANIMYFSYEQLIIYLLACLLM